MPVVAEYIPSPEELAEAITEKNRDFIESYLAAITVRRAQLVDKQTLKLREVSEAQTELNITKSAIKNIDVQMQNIKSVLYGWGRG